MWQGIFHLMCTRNCVLCNAGMRLTFSCPQLVSKLSFSSIAIVSNFGTFQSLHAMLRSLHRARGFDKVAGQWLDNAPLLGRCMSSIPSPDQEGVGSQEQIDFGFKQVPKEEKQSMVGQVFSSVAPSYDVMNDLMSGGLHRLWKDRLVEKLRPFPGMRHLDVAGGTGDVAFRVLEAMKRSEYGRRNGSQPAQPGVVIVCDINASMLQEGEKRAAAQGLDHRSLQWVEGNAEHLPFEDSSLDSYTVAFGIRNVTDRDAALREAHRVLKPGGRFLCLEFSKVVVPGLQQLYDMYSFNVIPQIGRVVANDAASYQYLVESIRMFPDQEAWAAQIEDAGFRGVDYENLTCGVVAIHSGFKLE